MLHLPMPGSLAPRCWWKFVDVIRYVRASCNNENGSTSSYGVHAVAPDTPASDQAITWHRNEVEQISRNATCKVQAMWRYTYENNLSTLWELPRNERHRISINRLSEMKL